jgi:hypothetical protein
MSARQVIEVEGSNTVADFERRLGEIAEASGDADLLLPRKLKKRFIGGLAAQLQLLVTWRHSCPTGRVRLHTHSTEGAELERLLERFVRTDHGLAAACLAELCTRSGDEDLSSQAQPIWESRMKDLQPDVNLYFHGQEVLGVCLDDSNFAVSPNLYFSAENPREDQDFETLAKKAIEDLWPNTDADRLSELNKPEAKPLGKLLCELFHNTHFWARRDAFGRAYPPKSSLRGIRLELLNFLRSEEADLVAEQPTLAAYMQRPELAPHDERRRLVEMTIFDCGPGIASRELLRKGYDANTCPPPAAEQKALRECLKRHFSSDRFDPSKGVGLHESFKCLSQLKSFLWVRSGHLSLYRDFVAQPYDPENSDREPFLLDWTTQAAAAISMPRAQGAFITALIPITHRSEQISLSEKP